MLVIGLVLLAFGLILMFVGIVKETRKEDHGLVSFLAGGLLMLGVITLIECKEITPMDVYQGKTTLRITYQDSIPVDSCVVWKKDINH